MLKAIIFDFDGVIVDSEPLHYQAFADVTRRMGYKFEYRFYVDQFVGRDDRDAFREILRLEGRESDLNQIKNLCFQKQIVFEQLAMDSVSLIPGALQLITQSYEELPIAIASGSTMADIELMLRKVGLRDYFQILVTADDVERSKPEPRIYELAVQRLSTAHPTQHLRPEDCLAIEDTGSGIDSALGAGLRTLGVATTVPLSNLRNAERVTSSLTDVTVERLREWFTDS